MMKVCCMVSSYLYCFPGKEGKFSTVGQRRKKGWKPGRNFPERFQVWQKVLGQNIRMMFPFLISQEIVLKYGHLNEKYICHSCFHVSGEITFSFFDSLKFLTAETFLHLNIISANQVPLFFLKFCVAFISETFAFVPEYISSGRESIFFK